MDPPNKQNQLLHAEPDIKFTAYKTLSDKKEEPRKEQSFTKTRAQ